MKRFCGKGHRTAMASLVCLLLICIGILGIGGRYQRAPTMAASPSAEGYFAGAGASLTEEGAEIICNSWNSQFIKTVDINHFSMTLKNTIPMPAPGNAYVDLSFKTDKTYGLENRNFVLRLYRYDTTFFHLMLLDKDGANLGQVYSWVDASAGTIDEHVITIEDNVVSINYGGSDIGANWTPATITIPDTYIPESGIFESIFIQYDSFNGSGNKLVFEEIMGQSLSVNAVNTGTPFLVVNEAPASGYTFEEITFEAAAYDIFDAQVLPKLFYKLKSETDYLAANGLKMNPEIKGTYDVKIVAENSAGNADEWISEVTVEERAAEDKPVLDFSLPANVKSGETVVLRPQISAAGDRELAKVGIKLLNAYGDDISSSLVKNDGGEYDCEFIASADNSFYVVEFDIVDDEGNFLKRSYRTTVSDGRKPANPIGNFETKGLVPEIFGAREDGLYLKCQGQNSSVSTLFPVDPNRFEITFRPANAELNFVFSWISASDSAQVLPLLYKPSTGDYNVYDGGGFEEENIVLFGTADSCAAGSEITIKLNYGAKEITIGNTVVDIGDLTLTLASAKLNLANADLTIVSICQTSYARPYQDADAPTVSVVTAPESTYSIGDTVNVEYTASDLFDGTSGFNFYFEVIGEERTIETLNVFPVLDLSGEIKIKFWVEDNAGNKSEVHEFSAYVYSEQELTDMELAAAVEAKIAQLDKVISIADEAKIEEARAAYDALTVGQKELVTSNEILEAAEQALAEIKKQIADEKIEQDRSVARAVSEMIAALPEKITLDSKDDVAAARAGFDALTSEQRAYVENLAVLEAAEKRISELESGGCNASLAPSSSAFGCALAAILLAVSVIFIKRKRKEK